MDVTCGLISNLVKTKSVERVLAPIASQVSLLIILNENTNKKGSISAEDTDVGTCAQKVSSAVETFIEAAKLQARKNKNKEFKDEMFSACETLDLVRSRFFIAAQKYQATSSRERIQEALVQAAKDVLQGVLKVLMVSDNAEVNKIVLAVNHVRNQVQEAATVPQVKLLVPVFKALSEHVMLLISLTTKRQKDLICQYHREQLITSITVLCKLLPALNTAIQTYLKYPDSSQALNGKQSIVQQLLSTLTDIEEAVKGKVTRETTLHVDEPGYFASRLDMMIHSLSEAEREAVHLDFETWTAGVVRHSMAVAHQCRDDDRHAIIQSCQKVLQLKNGRMELLHVLEDKCLESYRCEHTEVCERLVDEICCLEERVNLALVAQMVDVFKESSEPLERLLKAALTAKQTSHTDDHVQSMEVQFTDHADRLYQVTSLAASSCMDSKRVRMLRASLYRLEKIDPDLVPTIRVVGKESTNMAALRHLKLLARDWKVELSALVDVLDEMVDPKLFIGGSELKIKESVSAVKGFIDKQDYVNCFGSIRDLFSLTQRVIQVADRVVDKSTDAIYRNGLLIFVKKLKQAKCITQEAVEYLRRDINNRGLQGTIVKHLQLLLGFVVQVKEGLSPASHPHITSPERLHIYTDRRVRLSGAMSVRQKGRETKVQPVPSVSESNSIHTNQECTAVITSLEPVQTEDPPDIVVSKQGMGEPTITDLQLKARQYVSAAVAGDKDRVALLTSDLLSWTNHIVEAAHSLVNYCHTDDLEDLCREVDDLTPEVISIAKYVCAGDISEAASLKHLAETWANQLNKAQVEVDMTVEPWKLLSDRVLTVIQEGNVGRLRNEISVLEDYNQAFVKLLVLIEEIPSAVIPELHSTLMLFKELHDNLENFTATIKTTADLIMQTSEPTDVNVYRTQLQQLGRDWAVVATCILSGIVSLTTTVYQSKQVKDTRLGEMTLQDMSTQSLMPEVNELKRLLNCVSTGDKDQQALCSEICQTLDLKIEELEYKGTSFQGFTEAAVFQKSYKQVLWIQLIIKVLEGYSVVEDSTEDLSALVSSFYTQAIDIHRLGVADLGSADMYKEDYLKEVSRMASNLTMIQQKILNAIQLSPDLEKRQVVRQSLDNIDDVSHQLIDKLRSLVKDTALEGNFNGQELSSLKVSWAAGMKKLLGQVEDMEGIRPSLLAEIRKLLKSDTQNDLPKRLTKELRKHETNENRLLIQAAKNVVSSSAAQETSNSQPQEKNLGSPVSLQQSTGGTPKNPCHVIMSSVLYLESARSQWSDLNNTVVQNSTSLVSQVRRIALYCRGEGDIESAEDLVKVAMGVVECGRIVQEDLLRLAEHCSEVRESRRLKMCAEKIDSFATQMSVIGCVVQNSPNKIVGERTLLRNASNLVRAVEEGFREAENVALQGLLEVTDESVPDIVTLVCSWKESLLLQRVTDVRLSPKDELGLRRVEEAISPSLVDILRN